MPALATKATLSDYCKLQVKTYHDHLKKAGKVSSIAFEYDYRGKHYKQKITVSPFECQYGNYRYYWLCPKCAKRVTVLYCAGNYICRHCLGLKYQTQHQQPKDRVFNRINAIRRRLGWRDGVVYGEGSRPKGMHHKTYNKLVYEHSQLTKQVYQQTLDKFVCNH